MVSTHTFTCHAANQSAGPPLWPRCFWLFLKPLCFCAKIRKIDIVQMVKQNSFLPRRIPFPLVITQIINKVKKKRHISCFAERNFTVKIIWILIIFHLALPDLGLRKLFFAIARGQKTTQTNSYVTT